MLGETASVVVQIATEVMFLVYLFSFLFFIFLFSFFLMEKNEKIFMHTWSNSKKN